jgi:hypothetical protein
MKFSLSAFAFLALAGSNLLRQGAEAVDTRAANKALRSSRRRTKDGRVVRKDKKAKKDKKDKSGKKDKKDKKDKKVSNDTVPVITCV